MRKKNIKEVAQNYSLVPQSKDAENRTPDEQAADIARDFNEEEGDNVNANALIKSKQNLEEGDKVISVKQLREMALLTKYNGITLTSVGNILKENDNKLSNLINIADQVDEALKNKTYTFSGMAEHILNQNNAIFLKDKKGRKYTANDFSDDNINLSKQNHKGALLLKNGIRLPTKGLSISRDLSNIAFEDKNEDGHVYPQKWKEYLAQYVANPDVVGGNFLKQLKEAKTYAEQMDYYNFVRKTVIKDDNNGHILIGLPNKLLDGERRFVTNFYDNLENGFKTKKYKGYLDEATIRNFIQFSKNSNSTNSDFTIFEKNALKPCIEAFYNLIDKEFGIKFGGDDSPLKSTNTRIAKQCKGKPGKNSNLKKEDVEGTSSLQWLSLFVSQIKVFINAYASIYNKKRNEYAKVANDINDEMGNVIITKDDVRQTATDNIDIKKNLTYLISRFQKTYKIGIDDFIKRYKNNNKIITDITNNKGIYIDNAITRIKTIKPLLKGGDYVEKLLNILGDAYKEGVLKDRGANGGESATKRGVTQSSLTEASTPPTYIINETQLKELIRIGLI